MASPEFDPSPAEDAGFDPAPGRTTPGDPASFGGRASPDPPGPGLEEPSHPPAGPNPELGPRPDGGAIPAFLDDQRSFDSAFDQVAGRLRGDVRPEGDRPRAEEPAFDAGRTIPAEDPNGIDNGRLQGEITGLGLGSPSAGDAPTEDPPAVERSLPSDPDATKLTESPYSPGLPDHPDTSTAPPDRWGMGDLPASDDSATAVIDLASLYQAERATSGADGSRFDAERDQGDHDGPPAVPSLEGHFERPEYVGTPTFDRRSGSRRWWPLIVIGLAVLAAAASIGTYLVLRDNGDGGAVTGADPNGQGSFVSPYPVGTGVVVFYRDEATGEQRRWVIRVLEPVVDATDTLAGDGSADAPGDGEILAMARIQVVYQAGPEPGQLNDLRFNAAGATAGVAFDSGSGGCSDEPLDGGASLAVLESAEGNVCWQIPASQLDSLKLAIEAGPADGTVHLELN